MYEQYHLIDKKCILDLKLKFLCVILIKLFLNAKYKKSTKIPKYIQSQSILLTCNVLLYSNLNKNF